MSAAHVSDVRLELDRAAEAGRTVMFWWRDDDAVRATPEIDLLLGLAAEHDAPIAVAAIPARVEPSLVERLAAAGRVRVLPHGWTHADHAAGGKPSEFGSHRPLAVRRAEAREARETIRTRFGPQALDVFVPPWNRIDPALAATLPELGYVGLSAFGSARRVGPAGPRLLPANLDPVAWRSGRGLAAPEMLGRMVRTALADGAPIGLLTHHLMFDGALWNATRELLALFARHPAVAFVAAEALLAEPSRPHCLENAA